jgi:hypothetical protein
MYQTWVAQEIQRLQLEEDGDQGLFEQYIGGRLNTFLAELSPIEGPEIPFVIRMGPSNEPDPGIRKRYQAFEIDGDGRAFVMLWVDKRFVAQGWLYGIEAPGRPRRLPIPRGEGTGYGLDFMIAMQGELIAAEAFWKPMPGGDK